MKFYILLISLVSSQLAMASYAFYVGKNLTKNNTVFIGGTGEEVSSHWLDIVPAKSHKKDSTIKVGVTAKANYPGKLIEIPQVKRTNRYIGMSYTDFKGFPAPLINGGLNEHMVAVRDVWSPSRKELRQLTPNPQIGLNYSDLARIVLERATTAREGVEIIGELINEYGFATYGGNSHLIADENEGWVVIEYAGGQGLWAAKRLGPNDIYFAYPGHIETIPLDYQKNKNYMGSKNLISFAKSKNWFVLKKGDFHIHKAYGWQKGTAKKPQMKFISPYKMEKEIRKKYPKLTLLNFLNIIRDVRIADEEAGYGQAISIKKFKSPYLASIWIAPTTSVVSPFIPYFFGITDVLTEFKQHRYLTKGSARTFLNPAFQQQEGTLFAGRLFKRLLYQTCYYPKKFYPEVKEALTAFERKEYKQFEDAFTIVKTLLDSNKRNEAHYFMNFWAKNWQKEALSLGNSLLNSIEARNRYLFGLKKPYGGEINSNGGTTPNCLVGADPDKFYEDN